MLMKSLKLFFILAFSLAAILCCRQSEAFAAHRGVVRSRSLIMASSNGGRERSLKNCACSSVSAIRSKARNQRPLSRNGVDNGPTALDGDLSASLTPPFSDTMIFARVSARPSSTPLYIQYRSLRL